MIVFVKTFIQNGIILFFLLFPQVLFSTELVGILPFTNQRAGNQKNDWLGFYIQARIEANLRQKASWQFHSLSVLRLWNSKSNSPDAVSSENSILISGSFQLVLQTGYINVQIARTNSSVHSQEILEGYFTQDKLDEKIDQLSQTLGKWIKPDFNIKKPIHFPQLNNGGIKDFFEYRRIMYEPVSLPEIRHTLQLLDLTESQNSCEMTIDTAEGMLILSQDFEGVEQTSLLNKVEGLLKRTIRICKKNARLISLLAETFYLKKEEISWIKKTALEAIRLNSQDDLGYVLIAIISEPGSTKGIKNLTALKKVNPWICQRNNGGYPQFQKGILRRELSGLFKKKCGE